MREFESFSACVPPTLRKLPGVRSRHVLLEKTGVVDSLFQPSWCRRRVPVRVKDSRPGKVGASGICGNSQFSGMLVLGVVSSGEAAPIFAGCPDEDESLRHDHRLPSRTSRGYHL